MKIPVANNARPRKMKIPTVRSRFDIDSLRDEAACDGVFTLADFGDRSEGDQISLVEDSDPIRHPSNSVNVVRNDDQRSPMFGLPAHEQLVDFFGGDTV